MDHQLAVSFVHGYADLEADIARDTLPALWVLGQGPPAVYTYPFPRNVSDFAELGGVMAGAKPLPGAQDFKKLPRFGLTGLAESGANIYAGSWNGVYQIRKSDYALERIITNPLMNDMHGIWADEDVLITVLTGKDTVVISDHEGEVIDHFAVGNDLTVYRDESIEEVDWRFLSKQFRGATGLFHFNYVQRFGEEIWLTARNMGAFVVVNTRTKKAHLRTMNQKTAVLLHDGVLHDGEYYFTSIDAKIIIAADASTATFNPREQIEDVERFTRDLICEIIRLRETSYGREPNWCRGIACRDGTMYVTVDGLYGTDLSFGVLGLTRAGEVRLEQRLRWSDIGSEKDLKYVTGFDVLALDVAR